MTTLREAAQQALEALEAMQSYAAAERKGLRICDESITALRAALEQPERDWSLLEATQASLREHMQEIHRLRAALEQQEQEPVACLMENLQSGDVELAWNDDGFSRELWREIPLYRRQK
jgi:nitrate reductase assembly molybdenum cofactor insertion protein NarJ